jgi:hypothetical protein
MKNTLGWLTLGIAVSACGGGGGGGGSSGGAGSPPPVAAAPEVKVLSGAITRYAAQNTSIAFDVQIKPSFTPTGSFTVNASDKAGVIQPQVVVITNADGSYLLSLGTLASAAPGHYTGDITLKLCADAPCTTAQAVPSVTVPYDLTVAAPGTAWQGDRLSALVPWTGVADWGTFQGNAAHTGYVPVEIKPDQIGPRWKAGAISQPPASYGYNNFNTLTAANGIFYAAGSNVLKARKESDGSLVWSYDVSGLTYPSVNPPAVDNGIVYMAAGQQQSTFLFGFDAASGTVRFKAPMSSQWENYLAPVAVGDAVYTNAGSYGGLYAFTPAGEQMFVGSTAQTSMWSPAVDANAVYVYDGVLRIFDRKTGKVLSEIKDVNFQNYTYQGDGAVVLGAAGNAFVANYANAYLNGGSMANELLKYNTAKGFLDWRIKGNYPLTPAYADGVLYAPNTMPYRIEARAEGDGALLWSWVPGQASETAWKGEPVVTKNLLFVSTNSATYAIDLRTHKPVWSYPFAGRLALTRSGILYIQNEEALVALNLK